MFQNLFVCRKGQKKIEYQCTALEKTGFLFLKLFQSSPGWFVHLESCAVSQLVVQMLGTMKSLIILKFMVLLFMVLTLSQFTNGLLDVTRACEIALNRFVYKNCMPMYIMCSSDGLTNDEIYQS